MEGVLVSAATGALNSVLEKLGTLLVDGYKLHKGVHGEIKFLTAELTAMHAFLLKMSEEEDPDVQDKVWMSTVRELSYDIEDSIDDFMQDEDDKDTKPDGFISKIKHILGKLGKRKAHHQMFQDLKKQVIEAADRNQRYKTGQALSNTKNATVDPRALAIFEHASRLVGIDEPKAEIIKLLTEEDGCASTQHRPKVVSVVGSGGMGKTTLANQVYQDLKGKFKCRAFVSVSRNPDMMNILRTILSEVSGGYYSHTATGSIQQLLSNISDFLVDKSYFIVVDDIWEKKTWDVIKSAFPMNSCGIIITTTRIKDVANSCQSSFGGHIYNIRPLDIVQSRKLFHGRLFNSEENCPPYLKEVSDRILKKCAGLPLAIIAISGLLANTERTEDLWNQVKDSIGRALERNSSVEGMMKILSLSYFDLPPHLKTCLLYVSIFSEDSIIEKDDLIRRWIGEEFIRKEGRYTAHEIGERCFNELLNRGLIQPGRPNEYGEVENCQVHDTILDFIISKSIEENFVTLLGVLDPTNGTQSKVIRRLSLQGINKENSTILPACLVLSHVRSFHAGGFVKIPSLEEFRHLRVLDLSQPFLSNQQLEEHYLENIVTLFQLRYLHLKYTRIHKLPEQIGRLGCLEMLDLRGTDVKELPASIVNLRKLSHLLLDRHVKFPDGIAKMQALEMLKYVSITMQTFDFLSGLGELKNLRDLGDDLVFRVYSATGHVDVVREEYNKAIISSLCKLGTQNLHSLTILNGSSLLQEHLCLRTLKKLITRYSPVPQVPNWVSSLRNLQQLCLVMMRVKQNELCILGALPTLLILHLDVRESSEKLGISDEVGFQILRIFIYNANYNPVDLMFAAGSMPKLEKLVLEFLREVESESLDFGIENLPCLSTVEANGEYGYVKPVRTALERAVGTHPNHPSLLFRRLRRQWSILPDSDDELPTLRTSFYDTPI